MKPTHHPIEFVYYPKMNTKGRKKLPSHKGEEWVALEKVGPITNKE
jgi:hypothetical protein